MSDQILIVEDNPISRKVMRVGLAELPCEVLEAEDGARALAILADTQPLLIIADLGLPDMSGTELLARIRARPEGRHVSVVACSAAWSGFDEGRSSSAGFDGVLLKPVDIELLCGLVRGYLRIRPGVDERLGAGKRALAVDDDPVQRKLLAFRLDELGFATSQAANGEEALALAREIAPACVISDVMMPKLNGFELCRALRAETGLAASMTIILVTNSFVEVGDRELARRCGADDLVIRSPELAEIGDALRERIGTHPDLVPTGETADALDREHAQRIARQLERQVDVNALQARRCAALATELAIVNGISAALVRGQDLDVHFRSVLAACMDAGEISIGALCLVAEGEPRRVLALGTDPAALATCCDHPVFREALVERRTRSATGAELGMPARHGQAFLVVPVAHDGTELGALLLGVERADDEELIRFAETVANQLALAYMLARSFGKQVKSETEARNQARTIASIFDTVADAVVTCDAHGTVTRWNAAATALLGGISPQRWTEQVRFQGDDGVVPAPEAMPLERARRGEHVQGLELVARPLAGAQDVWLSANARPLPDAAGAVAVFRDVTEQRRAQAQLMVSDRMASIGMLAAGVAHEINNPLAALLANLEFLDEELQAVATVTEAREVADMRETLGMARQAADRVRLIVRDLKVFARAEEDTREPVDIEVVMDSSLRMAWNEIRHRAQIVKRYGSVPLVSANEARLGQVFLNLLVNAAQAIAEGNASSHQIEISTGVDERGWVVTSIRDTGPGIAPEIMPKLFTPFFTTKPAGQGTGLGLVICQRIIDGLGGSLAVESHVGVGTTFSIALPPCADLPRRSTVTRSPPTEARGARLFVIDDEVAVSTTIKRSVASLHEVATYADARLALADLVAGAQPDLIICDVMMPLMSGVEFYDRLVASRPDLIGRVVFLTGGAFTPMAREFLDTVPNPRIEKPFELATIRALIQDRLR